MAICRKKGGDLIKVSSVEENNFVKRNGKPWWLALKRDATHYDMFEWNDGSLSTFTDWNNGEPNNFAGNEGCVHQTTSGKWNDKSCSAYQYLACEKGNALFLLDFEELQQR